MMSSSVKDSAGARAALVCNLRQTASYAPPTPIMSTLLRKSLLWCMSARRLQTPLEALEAHGVGPLWVKGDYSEEELAEMDPPPDDAADLMAEVPPLLEALRQGEKFTDNQIRSLAGNGMHVPTVTAVILFVLAGTEPAPQPLSRRISKKGRPGSSGES